MGHKARESRASAALRKAATLKAMSTARSPYWRDRAKAGEKPQRGLRACPHCGINVHPTYGVPGADGVLKICEECRLVARSDWMSGLREAGIWPPKLPRWFDEGASRVSGKILSAGHVVNPREAEAIRLYDWLVATAGEPLVTVGIDDLWTMAEAVDRALWAMQSLIEKGERRARLEADAVCVTSEALAA